MLRSRMSIAMPEAPTKPTEDVGTMDMADLERLFEESIPCITHKDRPATWLVCHPVACELPVCEECRKEVQAAINEIIDHISTCSINHQHDVYCVACKQDFQVEEVIVRPLKS